MTEEERERLASRQRNLVDLIKDLESGAIRPEDLDKNTVAKLNELLLEKR